ncbi:tripartite tricarboxylate transporter substrate binding protein [Oceanobacillus longus]|uniref:Tripartite tricarboxylate transporter substrate binding protein n=1 Tax=Oceanobacillus longus TaxID=930120 RepID=A0ABV8GUE6_9BACI
MKNKLILFISISIMIWALIGCSQSKGSESVADSEENSGTEEQEQNASSDYPNKPIEVIIPFQAGGSTDLVGRVIAKHASKYLPNEQTIAIINKPGATGTVGMTEVQNADPDGYTIGLATIGALSMEPAMGNTVYSHEDFSPIMSLTAASPILLVKADAPWETYQEWLEYVKENPGEFKYGWGGLVERIPMEVINQQEGLETTPVVYDGSGESTTAVLGGQIDGAIIGDSSFAKSFIDSGEMRGLLILNNQKPESYSDIDIPIITDIEIELNLNPYVGFVGPKDIPEDYINILHDALQKTLDDPEVTEELQKLGVEINYGDPEQFGENINSSYETTKQILEDIGMIE